ncbi:hypothetical protein [Kineosporia babensis]|uniref:Uncharacterized protein n=1 Tax=Kineosporia babensis TaxID=499548 RepID=A0A9X1NL35_9ACTN|nr:hypothetical protein [Kineosporia babensis]MCD5317002.1 hypothetical protein [Kineosporia babensis]
MERELRRSPQAAVQQKLNDISAALAGLDEGVDTMLMCQDDAVLSGVVG